MDLSDDSLLKMFRAAVQDVAGYLPEHMNLESELAMLGIDSITVFGTLAWFEDNHHIRLKPEELEPVVTVRDLMGLVRSKIEAKAS